MLDKSIRLQLAGLVSAASWGYSPPNPWNVAGLAMKETSRMSDGAMIFISAGRMGEPA